MSIGADEERIAEAKEEFKKLMEDPRLIYTPICIVANKQDKPNAIKEERVKEVCFPSLLTSYPFHSIPL